MSRISIASSVTSGEKPFEKKIKLDIQSTISSSSRCIVCSAYREIGSNVAFNCLHLKKRAKIFVKRVKLYTEELGFDHFEGDALSEKSLLKITASSNCFSATSEDI